jgi:hypothetical protein
MSPSASRIDAPAPAHGSVQSGERSVPSWRSLGISITQVVKGYQDAHAVSVLDNTACITKANKVGPDNGGQRDGCDSVRITITGTMIQREYFRGSGSGERQLRSDGLWSTSTVIVVLRQSDAILTSC